MSVVRAVRTHREDDVEQLFRERLARKYGWTVEVPAAAAASSHALRTAWRHCQVSVAFEEFARDAAAALQHAYDRKYGVWDDVNDLRALFADSWHSDVLPYLSQLSSDAAILGVGVNDGREIRQLFPDGNTQLDVLDISGKAIAGLARQLGSYRRLRSHVGTFEDWKPFRSAYDLFFSLRMLNCTAVDRRACTRKAINLVKAGGTLLLSVSNGYLSLEEGQPTALKGMYSYETRTVDEHRPWQLADEIRAEIDAAGARVLDVIDGPAEIFIVAAKERAAR
jgi:Methyltransferase domain